MKTSNRIIQCHFDEDKSLDLVRRRGEPSPPLLGKRPRYAIFYRSWLACNSFLIFANFWFTFLSSIIFSLLSSSSPVFTFFYRADSSSACFDFIVLTAVDIFIFLAIFHASFYFLSRDCSLSCTLCASVYLFKEGLTAFVWPYGTTFSSDSNINKII
jgi:hypothetical protein